MDDNTKQQIVEALLGTQIGAIMACALGVEIDGPRFTSKAVITSDGFVQANFVDAQGTTRHSAFVGSYDDLKDNLQSVQEYLREEIKIDEGSLSELWQAVAYDWIATDYRS
jgi:hypothetical protein